MIIALFFDTTAYMIFGGGFGFSGTTFGRLTG
jgi:hypothetical protein